MDGWKVYSFLMGLIPSSSLVPLWISHEYVAAMIMACAGVVFVRHLTLAEANDNPKEDK